MQHRIKGQFTLDGPTYSVRANHPIATRLWSDGYSFAIAVGRWAVVAVVPGSFDPSNAFSIYDSFNVARMTSKSRAAAYARRHCAYGPLFRARVVRWRRWMELPSPSAVARLGLLINRERRLRALLGLESL